ncbi:MAG TPA: hypothetical protein VJM15_06985 [Sphingomicrobium sp.]|nr:hypothetical protein [Sphingomicrobium sp.]
MAAEPKPFASLSSGLLARKGAARPAMKPQGFNQMGGPGANLEDLGWNDMGFEPPKPADSPIRDDHHDAFGEEIDDLPRAHPTGLTPVHSPVHSQQSEIADRLGVDEADEEFDETAEPYDPESAPVAILPTMAPAPRRASKPRAAPGTKGKAAFTLRLDPERHLRLRLACAVNGRSAQQLVTDALDQLLANMPELEGMAVKAKRKG